MKFEIKHKLTGAILFALETESMRLCIEAAIKSKADLQYADLQYADLRYADLRYAEGVNPSGTTALRILLDQPGKIRAYKLVNDKNVGPYNGGIVYHVGKSVSVKGASLDITEQCAAGINVATLDWCIREWRDGYKILLVEFTAKDIAAIPTATDGKFRLHKCKVVRELKPKTYGLAENWQLPKDPKP